MDESSFIDVELNCLDIELFNTYGNFLFFTGGNGVTGVDDTIIEKIINHTKENGCIITKNPKDYPFIRKDNVYKTYSTLLAKRFFSIKGFLIIDNTRINSNQIQSIKKELDCSNTLFIHYRHNTDDIDIDTIKYNYIFINNTITLKEINDIYNKYIIDLNLLDDPEYFYYLIDTLYSGEYLVIDIDNCCFNFFCD